jgi:hypothetical protein
MHVVAVGEVFGGLNGRLRMGGVLGTSIGRDSEAPYHLASLNAQRRSAGIRICSRIGRTETRSAHAESGEQHTEHPGAPPDNSRAQ